MRWIRRSFNWWPTAWTRLGTADARRCQKCNCGSTCTASCLPSPLWTPPASMTANAPFPREDEIRRHSRGHEPQSGRLPCAHLCSPLLYLPSPWDATFASLLSQVLLARHLRTAPVRLVSMTWVELYQELAIPATLKSCPITVVFSAVFATGIMPIVFIILK